ncbi:hypothetical protein ACVW1A_000382 [Bradyrhizobium sp. LB1.3]
MYKIALRPEVVMCSLWAVFVLLFFAVPIEYYHAPGLAAWGLMASGVMAFSFGSMVDTLRSPSPSLVQGDLENLDAVIVVCAVAGLAGAAFIAIDKVLLSAQDWSGGITALRDRRSVEVMEGIPIKRSWLLYLGYLTISFSCASFCLFLLRGEKLGRLAAWLAQASVLAMVVYAVVYGGRMPILLTIVLAIGCVMVRRLRGRSLLPAGWYLWPKVLLGSGAFLLYTNAIWSSRRQVGHIYNFGEFLRVASEKWELKPSGWLVEAVRKGELGASGVMDFISSAMYLTHSPTSVQRFVEHYGQFSTYFGLYQVGVLSPLFDVFAPGLKLPETMRGQLAQAGLYGWFPNAWGAWFLDAGFALGFFAILAWGFFSGTAYRVVANNDSIAAELLLAFAYSAILISPLNGPFGMANSFLIFSSFVSVALWLHFRRPIPRPHVVQ